jgi:hypothetical protein
MEVLISGFILSVGLLALAALLPVGSYTIMETIKADRAGDCGRAALHDAKVRQMINPYGWWDQLGNGWTPQTVSLVIDPLGMATFKAFGTSSPDFAVNPTLSSPTYNSLANPLPRLTCGCFNLYGTSPQTIWPAYALAQAQAIFTWPDDLTVTLPELMSPAQPFGRSRVLQNLMLTNMAGATTSLPAVPGGSNGRPAWQNSTASVAWNGSAYGISGGGAFNGVSPTPCGPYIGTTGTIGGGAQGDYSWFLTVTPQFLGTAAVPATRVAPLRSRVSVVVCYKRDFGNPSAGQPPAERAVPVNAFYDLNNNVAISGGSILLGMPVNDAQGTIRVREGDWVALFKGNSNSTAVRGLCTWYRVIAIADPAAGGTQALTLNGPDWPTSGSDQDFVIAVGQSVLGVYTTTVDVDQDPGWLQ